jgi:hypothetical protein
MPPVAAITKLIKQRTIELVKTLRQYSIPEALEGEIEGYLTGVLDQMDLLQAIDPHKPGAPCPVEQLERAVPFRPLEKPRGDQGDVNFEDTLRDISNQPQQSQNALHDKIEHILRSIEAPPIEEDSGEESQSQPESTLAESHQASTDSRFKGAHKFSSLYLRDGPKARKGKLL